MLGWRSNWWIYARIIVIVIFVTGKPRRRILWGRLSRQDFIVTVSLRTHASFWDTLVFKQRERGGLSNGDKVFAGEICGTDWALRGDGNWLSEWWLGSSSRVFSAYAAGLPYRFCASCNRGTDGRDYGHGREVWGFSGELAYGFSWWSEISRGGLFQGVFPDGRVGWFWLCGTFG